MDITVKNKLKLGLLLLVVLFSRSAISASINIVTEHLAPFQIVKDNTISGLFTEIIEATLKEANITYHIDAHPWSLSYNRALKEENTCIYSIVRIPQRDALFQWVGHIATSSTSFYSLKNSPIKISSLEQAKDYKVAVIKDDVAHHYLLSKGFIENKNIYVMDNNEALLKLLEVPNRQIDLIVINDDLLTNRVNNAIESSKYKNVHTFENFKFEFYFACSLKTEKSIIQSLSKAMDKLERKGVFTKIKRKWLHKMGNII
ncbi:substrate-binding periplasmic protein [Cognaticolwellia beringensis]|uniref:substrate-binding periplasmic protein n=1 Tax=Cognaticolwellia beringensis TaxID=1967665 RepID=UPI0012F791F9|nr:transporter substrate-binding domain-containing protein [Cognaticolwellia beringensis]